MENSAGEKKEYICTVVLVAYNHRPYISRAIESVLCQKTNYPFKIHIFDDASDDGTSDIVREYAEKYPDIIIPFIAESNRGAQQNIWEAYSSAKTKYCAFLECDDYWCDKEKLQLQIDAMEQNPDCSFCAHNTIYQNGGDIYREKEDGKLMTFNRNVRKTGKYEPQDFIPLYGAGWMHHANSRVIRMECVDFDSLTDKEDFLYDNAQFFYLLNRGKLYFIDRCMSVYYMNMSSTFTSQDVLKKIQLHWDRMLHINESTGKVFARLLYRHIAEFASYWIWLDDVETGVKKEHSALYFWFARRYRRFRFDLLWKHRLIRNAKCGIKALGEKI